MYIIPRKGAARIAANLRQEIIKADKKVGLGSSVWLSERYAEIPPHKKGGGR